MKTLSVCLALLVLAGAACQAPPPTPVEPGPGTEPGAGGEAPEPAPVPPPLSPEDRANLMADPERAKTYFDLDQYTLRYMEARDRGDASAAKSIRDTVLRPLVDRNVSDLMRSAADAGNPAFRRIAVRALGFGTDRGVIVPALVPLLAEKDATLVGNALVSVYLLEVPETPVGPLVGLLNHQDADVRNNAALALGRVLRARTRAGLPPTDDVRAASGRLVYLVSNPTEDEFVRAHAAAALGAVGDPAAVDVLVNVLRDGSSAVRTRAAEGLGYLGRPEAVPSLIDALEAGRPAAELRVVCAALEAIAKRSGWPCDAAALGTDAANWRAWHEAVSR